MCGLTDNRRHYRLSELMAGVKIAERLDLYATLGLNRSSREIEVKRAYKKLALSNHPDKNKGTDTEFLYIGFAYHVLSDAKLRAVYDANEVEFSTSRQTLIEEFNSEKALEIFDAFFGTANPFAALSDGVKGLFDAEEKARQPKPAPPINLSLVCTLEDLYNGVKKSVAVPKQKIDNEGREVDYTKTYIIQVESQWISGTKLRYVKEPEDMSGDVIFTVAVEKHKTFTGYASLPTLSFSSHHRLLHHECRLGCIALFKEVCNHNTYPLPPSLFHPPLSASHCLKIVAIEVNPPARSSARAYTHTHEHTHTHTYSNAWLQATDTLTKLLYTDLCAYLACGVGTK